MLISPAGGLNKQYDHTVRSGMGIGPENKRCSCRGKPRLRVVWKADCGCAGLSCPKCGKEFEYYCAPHLLLRAR